MVIELVRTSISRMLSEVYKFTIVGEAKTGEEAVRCAASLQPDIVLMDVKMPGIGGLEATRKICQRSETTKVIALTGVVDDLFAKQIIQAGASAYITKGEGFDEIVTAIRAVLMGEIYLSSGIAKQLALRNFTDQDDKRSPFEKLSERELLTAIMISRGSKVQDIADTFNVSPKTINSYRYRIFEKLSLNNDVELTLLAIKHKLLEDDAEI